MVRLPHISNFTDFSPLEEHPALSLRYAAKPAELGEPDLILLPGTKNTMGDLRWLFETGFAERIRAFCRAGTPVLGVCGGYQMLGRTLSDPEGVEQRGKLEGLGLLPCETVFTRDKTRTRKRAICTSSPFDGAKLEGYEIHMGRTERLEGEAFCRLEDGGEDGATSGHVFGTYLHGLFDSGELTVKLAEYLAARRGIEIPAVRPSDRAAYRGRQYDLLADAVRKSLDMERIYQIMGEYAHEGSAHTD